MFLLVTPILFLDNVQKIKNEESLFDPSLSSFYGWTNDSFIGNDSNATTSLPPEPPPEPRYWALILLVIPLFTICGNGLVILSVWKFRNLHTAINFLIMGLAMADMTIALAVVPFAVYVEVSTGMWHLGPLLCDIYSAMDVACSTASIMTLTIISFDRYRAVKQPIEYSKQTHNLKRVFILLGGVWLISITVAVPILAGINHQSGNQSSINEPFCRFYHADFLIWSSVISFGIPLATLLFVYTRILIEIRKRTRMSKMRKSGYVEVKPEESRLAQSVNNASRNASLEHEALLSSRAIDFRNNGGANFTSCGDLDSHQTPVSVVVSPEHKGNISRKGSSGMSQSMNIIINTGVLECSPKKNVDPMSKDISILPYTGPTTEGVLVDIGPAIDQSLNTRAKLPNGHGPSSPRESPKKIGKPRKPVGRKNDEQLFVVIATVRPIKSPKKKRKQPLSDTEEIKFIDDRSSGAPSPIRKTSSLGMNTIYRSRDAVNHHGSSPAKSSRSKSSEDDTLPDGVSIRSINDSTEIRYPITESTSMPIESSFVVSAELGTAEPWLESTRRNKSLTDNKSIEPQTPENSERSSDVKSVKISPASQRNNALVSNDTLSALETLDTKKGLIPRLSRNTLSDSAQNLTSYGSCSELGTSTSFNSFDERPAEKRHLARFSLQEKRRISVRPEGKSRPGPKKSLREFFSSDHRSRFESDSHGEGTPDKQRTERRKSSQKKRLSRAQKKERKATKTLGIVVGVFLFCWVPFFTLNFMNALCLKYQELECSVGFLPFFLTTWLGYMNSFMNPLIYTIFNVEFRRAFKQLLCPWHSAPARSRRI